MDNTWSFEHFSPRPDLSNDTSNTILVVVFTKLKVDNRVMIYAALNSSRLCLYDDTSTTRSSSNSSVESCRHMDIVMIVYFPPLVM